jgi:PPOX class probable FMN-dependent enzyme
VKPRGRTKGTLKIEMPKERDMFEAKEPVRTAAEIRELLGPPFPSQENKVIDRIDHLCRAWIERSPFICISTCSATGAMDVSPKGDPPGFVKILDEKTLAIPDRMGNHRGDTLFNILERPGVAIVFLIPLRKEVVRVNGTAEIAKDSDLLDSMLVNQKRPDLAIIVRVREAFFHCGKAIIRSNLWEPEKWYPVEGTPSYAQALKEHANSSLEMKALEDIVTNNEKARLY